MAPSTKNHNRPRFDEAPLWRLGFRPFFLLSTLFALIAMVLWTSAFAGLIAKIGAFSPVLWHAHEMIYGYATAVIAGFVLTASQNWTGMRGVHGWKLKALVALWILGRLSLALAAEPNLATALIDLCFYPALAASLLPYVKPSDMKPERIFIVYFAMYLGGNLLMHLEALGVFPGYGLRGALLGLHTTILMIIFMGGRVIPFFAEGERSKNQPVVRPWLEISAHLSAWAFLLSQLVAPESALAAAIALSASVIHFLRLGGWYVRRVRRVALLWVLYFAYFFIAAGFALSGLAGIGVIPLGSAVHAFTVGGLGAMTYGMMSRVALGHTGRPLRARKPIVAGYALLFFSCLVRVIGPLVPGADFNLWILSSGVLWIIAFGILALVYTPMLLTARVDRRDG